jgi:hypothetical protein
LDVWLRDVQAGAQTSLQASKLESGESASKTVDEGLLRISTQFAVK